MYNVHRAPSNQTDCFLRKSERCFKTDIMVYLEIHEHCSSLSQIGIMRICPPMYQSPLAKRSFTIWLSWDHQTNNVYRLSRYENEVRKSNSNLFWWYICLLQPTLPNDTTYRPPISPAPAFETHTQRHKRRCKEIPEFIMNHFTCNNQSKTKKNRTGSSVDAPLY